MKKLLLATAIVIGVMWANGYDLTSVRNSLTGWADGNARSTLSAPGDWG